MSDIEDEIRRQIISERTVNGPAPTPPDTPPNDNAPYYAALKPPPNASYLERKKSQGGIVGAIAGVLLLLAKIGAPVLLLLGKLKFLLVGLKLLTFGKLLLTFGSMFATMWAYSTFFGWPFAVGFVLLIFIHECGHALAAYQKGHPMSFMIFIPFMGGMVAHKGMGRSIVENAYIGIMGPVVGTLACVVCALLYLPTQNPFWLALATTGFFINLFNLAPTVPLDGGWITPLFSPKAMVYGLVVLIAVGFLNPFIWLLGLMSLPRIIGGWKADPKTQPYYQVTKQQKWAYGIAYLGLAAFLGICWFSLHMYLRTHHPLMA